MKVRVLPASLGRAGVIAMTLATAGCQEAPQREIRSTIDTWIEHGDVVGAELLILRDDRPVMHEVFGWADREAGRRMQPDAIFSLASLTKPVTALAVLMLVDAGTLSLDDAITGYIPEFRGAPDVTIRELLAQTSGDDGRHGGGGYNIRNFATLAGWVGEWAASAQTVNRGEFAYSNFNYAALGYIVERVSGSPLGRFVTEHILEPLGMHDTHVAFSSAVPWAARVPASYMWSAEADRHEAFWTPNQPQRWAFFPGALGLWGTARDYARFVTFWLDLGVAGGRRLVSEDLVRAALTPQGFRDGEPVYGYGWFLDGSRTGEDLPLVFRHGGGDGTLALGYPADRGVVVYLSQSERPPDHVRALENLVAMSSVFHHPGPEMQWASEVPLAPVPLPESAVEYEGPYRGTALDGEDQEVVVSWIGGVLRWAAGPAMLVIREQADLVPLGGDTFTFGRYEEGDLVGVDPPVRVRFAREGGQVTSLELFVNGDLELSAKRTSAIP